jgi:hypothetical protein
MADNMKKNLRQQGSVPMKGDGQEAPSRNPAHDRETRRQQDPLDRDRIKRGDDGSYKEGGQNEHMKR